MSFGPDIEELLDDIGTAYTIIRDSGNITGEKLLAKVNRQVTKPFIREFFTEATLAYNSVTVGGDIIQFDDGTQHLIVNNSARNFENEAFDRQAVLYKCNVSGELQRLSGSAWNGDYQTQQDFVTVNAQVYGLFTEELYGNIVDEDNPVGQVSEASISFFFPASIGIQELDRYVPVSGEQAYKIEDIDKHLFNGVWVAHLEKDTR